MFKLIGIVVVVAVFVLGFDAIRKWYVGDATPQETVSEVRKVVGEKIGGEGAADNNSSKSRDGSDGRPQPAARAKQGMDTDEMLRKLMEKN